VSIYLYLYFCWPERHLTCTYLSRVVWIPGLRPWRASMKTYQLSGAYNLTHHSLNNLFGE